MRKVAIRFLRRGDRARDSGDWHRAARSYAWTISLTPKHTAIWVQYGHALKHVNKMSAAEHAYRTALTQNFHNADTHLQLGHLLKIAGRKESAAAEYFTALALDPTSGDASQELINLGYSVVDVATLRQYESLDAALRMHGLDLQDARERAAGLAVRLRDAETAAEEARQGRLASDAAIAELKAEIARLEGQLDFAQEQRLYSARDGNEQVRRRLALQEELLASGEALEGALQQLFDLAVRGDESSKALSAAEQALADSEAEAQRLAEQLHDAVKDIERQEDILGSLRRESALGRQTAQAQIAALVSTELAVMDQIAVLHDEIDVLRADGQIKETTLASLRAELRQVSGDYDHARRQFELTAAAAEADSERLAKSAAELRQSQDALALANRALAASDEGLRRTAEERDEALNGLERQEQVLHQRSEESASTRQAAEEQIAGLNHTIDLLRAGIDEKEGSLASLKGGLARVQEDFGQARGDWGRSIAEAQAEIERLAPLSAELEASRAELASAKAALAAAEHVLRRLSEERDTTAEQLERKEEMLRRLTGASPKPEAEDHISALSSAEAAAKERIAALEQEILGLSGSLQQALDARDDRISAFRRTHLVLDARVAELEAENFAVEQRNQELEAREREAAATIADLQAALAGLRKVEGSGAVVDVVGANGHDRRSEAEEMMAPRGGNALPVPASAPAGIARRAGGGLLPAVGKRSESMAGAFETLLVALRPDVVCDIGALDGSESARFRQALPHAQIVLFEPSRQNFERFIVPRTDIEGVRKENFVVFDRDGETAFYELASPERGPQAFRVHCAASVQGSLNGDVLFPAALTTVRLDTYFSADIAAGRRFMLRIDAEDVLEILAGASGVLANTVALWIETTYRAPEPGELPASEIIDSLQARSFSLAGNMFAHAGSGQGQLLFVHHRWLAPGSGGQQVGPAASLA